MRAASALDRVRAVGAHPLLERPVALALRARIVHGSGRFIARELSGSARTSDYRLRGTDLRASIRHGTGDVVTLGEVFHRPDYEFPTEVERSLGSRHDALTVLDLGANIGLFDLWMLSARPNARIESYEPDPANAAVLRHVVERNRLADRVSVVEAAAGASDGEVSFEPGQVALSRIADDGSAKVAMVDVLPRLALADLLKMDIEGGEWAILFDERFGRSGPRAIVLEYHPYLAPVGQPPREAVERRLEDLGYRLAPIFHRADGHGMLWAWR
jgi:FkbM family methyltransferase